MHMVEVNLSNIFTYNLTISKQCLNDYIVNDIHKFEFVYYYVTIYCLLILKIFFNIDDKYNILNFMIFILSTAFLFNLIIL